MEVLASCQSLQPAAAVGQLPENVQRGPSLFDSNAIRLPSGVQTGLLFVLPSNVNRVKRLPGKIIQPDLSLLLRRWPRLPVGRQEKAAVPGRRAQGQPRVALPHCE